MYLYKLEVKTDHTPLVVIVIAESDEQAFRSAESQIRRHYVATPAWKEIALVEKKYVEKGKGYVIETAVL